MQNQKIIIGIGGNIKSIDGSHPVLVAKKAINLLKNYSIEVTKQSSWYETEPIPKSNQPNFFNCVVFADTILNELDVLKSLHKIEKEFGRIRKKVNEARVIDLDLIDYSSKILTNNEIIIPHPRAHTRRFVMEPLAELNPKWVHPILKINVCEILKKINNQKIKIIIKEKLN
tara:strand:+ start:124 stop:639 length:516 start_codon:yes stop_codon:yes gene_type:complete